MIKLWTAAAGFVTLNVYVQESTLSIIPFPSSSLLDGIQAGLVLDHRYRTIIEDRQSAISYIGDIPPDTWQIYTDGSKQGSLTGAGFCIVTFFFTKTVLI